MTVFIKRYPCRGELPKTAGYYDTNVGRVFCVNEIFDRPKKYYPSWWLQEIELPSEEEVCKGVDSRYKEWQDKGVVSNINESAAYKAGLVDTRNFILNHLKTNTNE